jgi:hypothetical protein
VKRVFGYLTAAQPEMKIKDFAHYRAVYCGLCHTLFTHCGPHTALLLNYDMAFLILLYCGLYEPEVQTRRARCGVHPVRAHEEIHTPYTAYAADMLILLSYHQLRDDWTDERRVEKLAASRTIAGAYRRAKEKYPRQAKRIEEAIAALSRMEKENEENIDRVSVCMGEMMAEILDMRQDVWSEPLRALGMALGQAIYLMDAYEDVEKDARAGRYNPLRAIWEAGELKATGEAMINACMARAAAAFERLPILQEADILRNILYAGVWTRFNAASARREKADGEKK